MLGTILNAAGILLGGGLGLVRRQPLLPARESFFRVTLGALTVFYGLRLAWLSLDGPVLHALKQLLIAVLALSLGKLTGRWLRLQKMSNRIGRSASQAIASVRPGDPGRFDAGFKTCAALFCAAPLGILGAVQEGLSGYAYPLGAKAVMDGLAAMGFARLFGWGTLVSALPVIAFQGTITLVCVRFIGPFLETHGGDGLVHSVNIVGGLLVFSVALVVLELKKIELADYLPSLAMAPLLTWLWS